jgi:hypothetical protein
VEDKKIANIEISGFPAKTDDMIDSDIFHIKDGSLDKKITKANSKRALANGITYTDSGAADVYVLTKDGITEAPFAYNDGFTAQFNPANTNTGPSTVNVESLGAISIKDADGNDLEVEAIVAGIPIEVIYRSSGPHFELIRILDSTTYAEVKSGRKNLMIGGNFDTNPFRRGSNFPAVANATFIADRFRYFKVGTMVHTALQDNSAPSVSEVGFLAQNSLATFVTTAQGSIGAGDVTHISYKIEGQDWTQIAQAPFVLSFWVYATKTGIYSVGMRNNGNDRSFVAEYTVNSSNTWQKIEIPIQASPSAGSWEYGNLSGLEISFVLAAGSNFATSTIGSWQVGNFIASTNQVNSCDAINNDFRIDLVQVEANSIATKFETRLIQDELELCNRYFERRTFASGTIISTGQAISATATQGVIDYQFKRAIPTLSITPGASALLAAGGSAGGGGAVSNAGQDHCRVSVSGAAGLVAGNASGIFSDGVIVDIDIDAEL